MPDPKTVLSDFMANKNKEALGEKASETEATDDNYLADDKVAIAGFSDGSIPKNEKALATFRRIMNIALMVPILLGAIFMVLYFLAKIGPSIIFFIRNIFIAFTKA
ncbi:MAG: hypothetical protein LBB13_03220 [Rickettsiales bacterium]|jgi:hypothetical protein|nr:hypothetical protein [Rickettsiales bacterium]